MKLCLISDTHCRHKEIVVPECDVLIHAGDACGYGTWDELNQFSNWFNEQTQAKKRLYIPGNHDRIAESDPGLCSAMFTGDSKLLIGSFEYDGVRFFGTPYTPAFCNWAFQGNDQNEVNRYPSLHTIYSRIPFGTDVVICHGPYLGTGDKTCMGDRVGSETMRHILRRLKPKLFVCGHIHEGYGVYPATDDLPLTVNAALSEDYIGPLRDPIVVEILTDG